MSSKKILSKPKWLKSRLPGPGSFSKIKKQIKSHHLSTVCVEASCPNLGKCWGQGTMTIMILGEVCSRNCDFCDVNSQLAGFKLNTPDPQEPANTANSLARIKAEYAVITSVTRDDLPDQGASHWVKTINLIKGKKIKIEVLIPDFRGNKDLLGKIAATEPEVFAHNIETVASLSKIVRPQANYQRSLNVLEFGHCQNQLTKTSLMIGMGETKTEILQTMTDLREIKVDILTIGQYLAPSRNHFPVKKYYTPEEFDELRKDGLKMGFKAVQSGPFVRSSYKAGELFKSLSNKT